MSTSSTGRLYSQSLALLSLVLAFPPLANAAIVGTVVWDGNPIPNATVEMKAQGDYYILPALAQTVTAADGSFRFENPPLGGPFVVYALSPSSEFWAWIGSAPLYVASDSVDYNVGSLALSKFMTLLAPANNVVVATTTPTLAWVAFPGSARYLVEVWSNTTREEVFQQWTTGTYMTITPPLAPDSYQWSVYAKDLQFQIAYESAYYFTVPAQTGGTPLQIITTTLSDASSGQAYTLALVAGGGSGTGQTWSIASGSLPTGFVLSSGGVLSSTGSPAAPAGAYGFAVQVIDSLGSLATQPLSLTIQPSAPAAPLLSSPANGTTEVLLAPTLVWNASSGATSYDVYFGTSSSPPMVTNTLGTTYAPPTLDSGVTYYWQISARNAFGSATSATWSFATGVPATGLRFVPVTPCRVVDTREAPGPFGGPAMTAGETRSVVIPQSPCGIPGTAQAYSLNVTVVPQGPLSYLTPWPTGQARPFVSTLNSFGGIVVANAAIVAAGTNGAVSVYVTNPTDVILDISGYFDTATGPTSYAFYPATPCRIADTRGAAGQFGGPSMYGGETRNFPIPLGPCSLPATAQAYSLNVTVVPGGYLGYLTTWPTGLAQPNVSTLNSWTGKVAANAALVPSGTNGSVSAYVSNPTDVILDANGYFAAPGGAGALSFYPIAPCRVADTRNADGPFGGPEMGAGATRSFAIPASACNVPSNAAAYSVNVTVVPDGVLSYLTAWPTGLPQPLVSTLNSFDGSVVANAAIVPAGTNGAISIFVTNPTHVVLDINGYFAP